MTTPVAKPTAIAFIPARSGSQRVPHKNVARLNGHPIMAYTIAAAKAAGVFDAVMLCTDEPAYAAVGEYYGAEVPFLRPREISSSTSPDIEWLRLAISGLAERNRRYDIFSILRPTSPFRRAATIRAAFECFIGKPGFHSLRAISPVNEHPGKMWVVRGDVMVPLMPLNPPEAPWHSQQMAALPKVYKQNASLEIAWTQVATVEPPTIAGNIVMPWITEGYDGFDINQPADMAEAQALIAEGKAALPTIQKAPYSDRLPGET
ncbi:MAG: acylneuraminate cytidylyltransferase family protein [Devosia sp.]